MKRREVICKVIFKDSTLEELKENGYIPYSGSVYIKREQYFNISKFNNKNNVDLFKSFIKVLEGAFDNKTVKIDREHLIYLEYLKIIEKSKNEIGIISIYY